MNKVLLEPSHDHSSMYYIWVQQQSCKGVYVPPNLKYLLSGPIRKVCQPLLKISNIVLEEQGRIHRGHIIWLFQFIFIHMNLKKLLFSLPQIISLPSDLPPHTQVK